MEGTMKVAIVGGLSRMEKNYLKACKQEGYKAKVYNTLTKDFQSSLKSSDCVLLMVNLCSHNMANASKNICKKLGIPFILTNKNTPEAVSSIMKEFRDCAKCEKAGLCWGLGSEVQN